MERKLYRSRENRMLFGVCGGIGDYIGVDPTVIRLGMILIGFAGVGILFYIAAGLIIPEAPRRAPGESRGYGSGNNARSRREDEAFDPVAGAKPEVKPEAQPEVKPDIKPESPPAGHSEPEISPEPETGGTEPQDESVSILEQNEPTTKLNEEVQL